MMIGSKDEIFPGSETKAEAGLIDSNKTHKKAPADSVDHIHTHHSHEDDSPHSDRAGHHHVHSEESLRRVVNRLSRIEGHIRGIKSMVQESRSCPDVLVQIAAVRGALDRVARMILDEHLTDCIGRAAKEGNIEAEIEELKAALDRFLP
ncbi:metal-sensing transcriptional repressor [Floridanema aerugineum]|jgi:DNA-binding FrmR family transcriptional regulator|uniref:Metal-sensing transcriptional repressor n=1 Tax=Floridaenema aerugineum BLCC-F46 TaxID=3153654 RepID=A0ABV4XE46_9CYAN